MSDTVTGPLPDLEHPLFRDYFQGLAEGRLCVQGCTACGHRQWPPRELCARCGGGDFHWPAVPGRGVVYTYSVVYRPPHPGFRDKVPYAIVVAELEGGLRMLGNAFGADVEAIACGVPVTARFRDEGGVTLLEWGVEGES